MEARKTLQINWFLVQNAKDMDEALARNGESKVYMSLLTTLVKLKTLGFNSFYIKKNESLRDALKRHGINDHYAKKVHFIKKNNPEAFRLFFKKSKVDGYLCFAPTKGHGINFLLYRSDHRLTDLEVCPSGKKRGIWMKTLDEKNIRRALDIVPMYGILTERVMPRRKRKKNDGSMETGCETMVADLSENLSPNDDACPSRIAMATRTMRDKIGGSFSTLTKLKRDLLELTDVEKVERSNTYPDLTDQQMANLRTQLQKRQKEDYRLVYYYNEKEKSFNAKVIETDVFFLNPDVKDLIRIAAKGEHKAALKQLGTTKEKNAYIHKQTLAHDYLVPYRLLNDPVFHKPIVVGGRYYTAERRMRKGLPSYAEDALAAIEHILKAERAESIRVGVDKDTRRVTNLVAGNRYESAWIMDLNCRTVLTHFCSKNITNIGGLARRYDEKGNVAYYRGQYIPANDFISGEEIDLEKEGTSLEEMETMFQKSMANLREGIIEFANAKKNGEAWKIRQPKNKKAGEDSDDGEGNARPVSVKPTLMDKFRETYDKRLEGKKDDEWFFQKVTEPAMADGVILGGETPSEAYDRLRTFWTKKMWEYHSLEKKGQAEEATADKLKTIRKEEYWQDLTDEECVLAADRCIRQFALGYEFPFVPSLYKGDHKQRIAKYYDELKRWKGWKTYHREQRQLRAMENKKTKAQGILKNAEKKTTAERLGKLSGAGRLVVISLLGNIKETANNILLTNDYRFCKKEQDKLESYRKKLYITLGIYKGNVCKEEKRGSIIYTA